MSFCKIVTKHLERIEFRNEVPYAGRAQTCRTEYESIVRPDKCFEVVGIDPGAPCIPPAPRRDALVAPPPLLVDNELEDVNSRICLLERAKKGNDIAYGPFSV